MRFYKAPSKLEISSVGSIRFIRAVTQPQDYSGLRDEIRSRAIDYETVAAKLWPRIQDNKSRWELHGVGLDDGYKMIVDDIIIALNEALKSISVAGNKLLAASATADSHNPDDTATS